MKFKTIFVSFVALGLVACSGGSEQRAPASEQQPSELTSDIGGQRVVSQRDGTGAVHAQLFDRAALAATLELDGRGAGTIVLTGGTKETVAMRAGTPLEEVNRGFRSLWAIDVRADGTIPLMAESWSSDSTGYCASSGYADCSNSCGGGSYFYRSNAAGCTCSC